MTLGEKKRNKEIKKKKLLAPNWIVESKFVWDDNDHSQRIVAKCAK